MISGSNINLDFLYLVNKKDLKGILETGIIKKSKKDSNYSDKVFLMRNTSINEGTQNIKVLVLKNLESNRLCDSPIKIWNLIKSGEETNSSNYKLYGISIENYLYRRDSSKKRKIQSKVKLIGENSNNTVDTNQITDYTSNLDKIIEVIVEGIVEERKDAHINYDVMIDSNTNNLELMIETILKGVNDNKNLIISERKNQIFLPYTVDEIDDFMRCYPRSYMAASDVVKKEFIINFTTLLKHPYKSRFEESYNLMRNRESKGVVWSFINAFRISLKRNLNPAVIAACKSKRELKKYLSCLKHNELENFETFNTIYELVSA